VDFALASLEVRPLETGCIILRYEPDLAAASVASPADAGAAPR
jgi:hypothetical protein